MSVLVEGGRLGGGFAYLVRCWFLACSALFSRFVELGYTLKADS